MDYKRQHIPSAQVEFVTSSGQDNTGRVFRYEGEIYRGIFESHADFYRQLFSSSLGAKLEKSGLIPTQIDSRRFADFDLILKHKTLPFVSYPIEWCSAMLRAAALLVCDIQLLLITNGLVLKDAHPFNVLFSGTTPCFVDVGSIERFTKKRLDFFIKEFINDFYLALLVVRAGYRELFDAFLLSRLGLYGETSRIRFLFFRLLLGVLPFNEWLYHLRGLRKITRSGWKDPLRVIMQLRNLIDRIPSSGRNRGGRGHNRPRNFDDLQTERFKSRIAIIADIVKKIAPESAIVFSDQAPLLSEYLTTLMKHVIAATTDEDDLNTLFFQNTESQSGKLLPLRLDLFSPTPSHGPWGICTSGINRLQSEIAIFFNLTPETLRQRRRTLNDAVSYLSRFSAKWSLIDFRQPNSTPSSSGYNIDEFTHDSIKNVLYSVYSEVKTVGNTIENGWIFLCSKKGKPFPTM
jgi:hypothetical protein